MEISRYHSLEQEHFPGRKVKSHIGCLMDEYMEQSQYLQFVYMQLSSSIEVEDLYRGCTVSCCIRHNTFHEGKGCMMTGLDPVDKCQVYNSDSFLGQDKADKSQLHSLNRKLYPLTTIM
jgi:hypothetical protein